MSSVDPIRKPIIGCDVVELGGGLIIDGRPGGPAVEGDAGPSIVPLNHTLGVVGIDPQVVVIAVRGGDLVEGLATIGRLPALEIENPNGVGVLGVGEDMLVVPRSPLKVPVIANHLPGGTSVIGPE